MSSVQEKETSNSLYRQWQILSRLSTGKWMGTRELQETLQREGIEIKSHCAYQLKAIKLYRKVGAGVQMRRFKACHI